MNILGISSFYYDSAACLLSEGEIVAAAQEERFTRKKHDNAFPINSIHYCLKEGAITAKNLDSVVFYSNNLRDRVKTYYFLRRMGYFKKIIFFSQKESYLASAFCPSNFSEAAILVNDGQKIGIIFGRGHDNKIEYVENKRFRYSLGALYSAVTAYLGFRPYSDEYKVMGLAAYGRPKYKDLLIGNLKRKPKSLEAVFGGGPYKAGSDITQEQMDVAASVQAAVESETLKIVESLYKMVPSENLCISGSLGLNCLLNTAILKQGNFKNIWIQPASTDAGCAIGVAYLAWHEYLGNKRSVHDCQDKMRNAFLGPGYSDEDIEKFLIGEGVLYKKLDHLKIPEIVADLIASGNIVGWFQGRMEFGPRALGARSILADSRSRDFCDRLNLKVKHRENFRPFAPTVLTEKANEYFDLEVESPYMLLVAQVKENKKQEIPAAVHIDNSSRIQTIERSQRSLYYDIVNAFYQKTGCPVIINTSFNTRNEPIVLNPQDAYQCFKSSDIDYLLMGRFLVDKKQLRSGDHVF
jgi:carbamoyltransferase